MEDHVANHAHGLTCSQKCFLIQLENNKRKLLKCLVSGIAQMLRYPRSIPIYSKKNIRFSQLLSQRSVEHDNKFKVNCFKSQDWQRTLAGEARTKAGNDTYF